MKKIFLIAAATFALAACDKNEDNPLTSQQAVITASIGESALSRAVDTTWTAGDKIGISSLVGTVAGPYVNLEYTTSAGDGKFTGTPIYFYKPMVLKAYYPYTDNENITDGIITADTGADMQESPAQQGIDFLFDSVADIKAADPNVNFRFAHKMSKLTFTFIGTEEVKDDDQGIYIPEVKVSNMVSYKIEGLVLDGTFDTATGVCAVTEGAEAEDLEITLGKGSVKDNEPLHPLIVFPQKPGNNNVKLHVYTDEFDDESIMQHYICTLTFGDGELKPGNSYKYTVKITKVGLVLKEMKIDDWNVARDVNVTATIDGGWQPEENQQ